MRKRSHRELHQKNRVVIRKCPIQIQLSTPLAAMQDTPVTIFSCDYGNRLHFPVTDRFPVSRRLIHMKAVKTMRTMIPMLRSRPFRLNPLSAMRADKTLEARLFSVIRMGELFFLLLFLPLLLRCTPSRFPSLHFDFLFNRYISVFHTVYNPCSSFSISSCFLKNSSFRLSKAGRKLSRMSNNISSISSSL